MSVAAAVTLAMGTAPALAVDGSSTATAWAADTPSVFGFGDSLFMQCGGTLGLGTRSLGMIGWGSATSRDMRARLSSTTPDWPYMSESSHAEELADAHDASSWVVGLGTNDVRGTVTPAQYADNVNWFMQQAAGRPVLWFNLYYPAHQARVATFNAILAAAAAQWPNLRILDWNGYATAHPDVLNSDRVHLASFDACRLGRFALIQATIPPVTGDDSPHPDWVDPAPQSPPTPDPVSAAYEQSGGPQGPLGSPSGDVTCEHKRDGCFRFFAHGVIAWSPGTGAQVMSAPVATEWNATFQELGRLGYPLSAETCGMTNGGCRQRFESGWMYWSSRTGARDLPNGPLLSAYLAAGAERSALGYPTGVIDCGLVGIGCDQRFQGGSIVWSSTTGTHIVSGAIGAGWVAAGAENSVLGYPTMDTRCGLRNGGCGQHFTGGTMYWSPATGVSVVGVSVRARYLALGAEKSLLGYPIGHTTCALKGGGCGQHFQGGSLFATSRTATAFLVSGAIRSRWLALGGVNGRYGYPLSDRRPIAGGFAQRFAGGTLAFRGGPRLD